MKYPRNFAVVLWIILATFEGCLSACGSGGGDTQPPLPLTPRQIDAWEGAKVACDNPGKRAPEVRRQSAIACPDGSVCCVGEPGKFSFWSYYIPYYHQITLPDSNGVCDDDYNLECEMENAATKEAIDRCFTPC